MKVDLRPLADIRPYDKNPRVNDDAVEAVARSIREFGFRQPIVVDADLVIICGHTRYKAVQKKVPIHIAKDLTAEQIKAYRIADNKTAELSDWNYDLLPIELSELQARNYDLGLLGFDQEAGPAPRPRRPRRIVRSRRGAGAARGDDTAGRPVDARRPPPALRRHCKPEDVNRLLDGATIQLVNTDPPYNVRVEPRSNNAIAAGLSSFEGTKHHQGLDLARHPEKAKPTGKKLRAKDRPLANGSATWPACWCRVGDSISGAATPTAPTTHRC